MNVTLIEVTSFSLTSNSFNLALELKQNSVYLDKIIKVNSLGELNFLNKENYVVYLSDKDYVNFSKSRLGCFDEVSGAYLINGAKVFIISSGNYLKSIQNIVEFKRLNGYLVYKMFNVSPLKIKLFFELKNVEYNVCSNGLDFRVEFKISHLNEVEKWEFLKEFILEFNDYIYAEIDLSLNEQLVRILKMRSLKMSTAESFTAGGLASYITSVKGSSQVFYEGVVSYDEKSKQDRLGVQPNTLKLKRPVSSEVAYEMAKGLLVSGVDVAVATTGLAGPDSDGSGLPIGLAFIAVGTEEKISVYKYNFSGSRKDITSRAIETAVFLLIKALRDGSFNV